MSEAPRDARTDEPFCSHCGYVLTGLTESSKCPECGRPLVEVLVRPSLAARGGKRWTSTARIFGTPLIQVALGPHGRERMGRARAVIAVGDIAVGCFAVGSVVSVGVVALGGTLAVGVVSLSALAVGLIAFGGLALGGIACAGLAAGVVAIGGLACGVYAMGGMAIGVHAAGGAVYGAHLITGVRRDPAAVAAFRSLEPFLGSVWPPGQILLIYLRVLAYGAVVAAITAVGVALAYLASSSRTAR